MTEDADDPYRLVESELALESFEADVAVEGGGAEHVLVVLHGIRSNGSIAHGLLTADFLRDAHIKAVAVTYARKSSLSLLVGWPDCDRERDVREQLIRIHRDHPGLPISLLCHSNGTRILAGILDLLPFEPRHVILAGSVCRMEITRDLPSSYVAVNEVGTRDFLPLLAEAVRPDLFQGTGTYGFNRYPVVDRFFRHGHGGVFERAHLEQYVVPIILTGRIKPHGTAPARWIAAVPVYLRRAAFCAAVAVTILAHL